MISSEKLTRLWIFMAVGYLCAGVLVSLLASLNYWLTYFTSNSFVGSVVILISFLIGATVGIAFMRLLVSRYGVKAVFEQDLLIAMIGLLFMTIAINQTMLIIGLLLTSAGLTIFLLGNAKTQADTARVGDTSVLSLGGWALGPLIAVIVITSMEELGSLPLRILFAHYLLIAFWVWIKRFSLHFDYNDVPNSIHKLVKIHNRSQNQARQPIKEIYKNKTPNDPNTTTTSAQINPNATTAAATTPHTTIYSRTNGSAAASAPNNGAHPHPKTQATSNASAHTLHHTNSNSTQQQPQSTSAITRSKAQQTCSK